MSLVAWKAGPIGIDFGDYAVRMMQRLGPGGRGSWTSDCHFFPPKPRGQRSTPEEMIDAARAMIRRQRLHGQRFKGRRVITALPARDLVVKNIRLPRIPDEELESAVRFEAHDRIPSLDGEAEIRFLPAATLPGREDGQQEVIVFAASGLVIREHLRMIQELGLESAGIDIAPLAALRAFQQRLRRNQDQDRVIALADLGRTGMRLTIARGYNVTFTKCFDFGGEQLDAVLAKKLSMSFEEAGALRRRVAAERRDSARDPAAPASEAKRQVEESTREGWDHLGKEISLCLRYNAVTFRGPRPEEVTCVGGEALDPWALECLSSVVGTPCRLGVPLRVAGLAEESGLTLKDAEKGAEAEWATAVGLAIKPVRRSLGTVAA